MLGVRTTRSLGGHDFHPTATQQRRSSPARGLRARLDSSRDLVELEFRLTHGDRVVPHRGRRETEIVQESRWDDPAVYALTLMLGRCLSRGHCVLRSRQRSREGRSCPLRTVFAY